MSKTHIATFILHSTSLLPIFYFTMLPIAQFSAAKVWLWIIIIIKKKKKKKKKKTDTPGPAHQSGRRKSQDWLQWIKVDRWLNGNLKPEQKKTIRWTNSVLGPWIFYFLRPWKQTIHRIRPTYRTVRLSFSKLRENVIVKYSPDKDYKDQKMISWDNYLIILMRFFL